jgi:ribulose-phosphate 3-epimerase
MDIKVAASVLSADLGRLNEDIRIVEEAGADIIHFDVMDGHFVPNLSFGAPVLKCMNTKLPVDIHLMIENPEDFIQDYANSLPGGRNPNGDIISVHAEVCEHLHKVVQQIKEAGFRASVAINPGTSLSVIEEVIDDLDMVLVMTVNPGYSGQSFIDSALDKVREIRGVKPDIDIEVDGGVNADTCEMVRDAGANILVSASYLFGSKDKAVAVSTLKGN